MYTVKQLADISGVTPRALRYYHKIGLLAPTEIAEDGYRYYGEDGLYADLAAAMPEGAGSAEAQKVVQRWRDHLEYFWSPTDQQLLGLADLYNDDVRFRRNYEATAPGLAGFMREAVRIFVHGLQR
jgi:TipAS antibiotic-recognition domain/MerR family regulatory protein